MRESALLFALPGESATCTSKSGQNLLGGWMRTRTGLQNGEESNASPHRSQTANDLPNLILSQKADPRAKISQPLRYSHRAD